MGATYYRFRKIHPSKKHLGLCKALNPRTEGHPYGAISRLILTLKHVFEIDFHEYVDYVDPAEFEDRHFWSIQKLELQKGFLPILENVIGEYRETVMALLKIQEKAELSAIISPPKLDLTEADIRYQEEWIRRWIEDLRTRYFVGYSL